MNQPEENTMSTTTSETPADSRTLAEDQPGGGAAGVAEPEDEAVGRRGAQFSRRLGRLPRPGLVTVLLSAALAGALALAGWLLLERRETHAVEAARTEATAQARIAAVALTSYDYKSLDDDFDAVRRLATDPLASQFDKASETLTDVLEKYQGTAKGKVVRAAVSSADGDRVEVLLFVDQTVTSSMQQRPRVDRNRIAMTLVRTDDGWRVSEADLL